MSSIDFALGDTAAMAGHSPLATVAAVERRIGSLGGLTTMLPTEDAEWVAAELTRRFGLARWSFALGDRRQPLGPSPGPADHRPPEGPRLLLLLPRQRRRDLRRGGSRWSTRSRPGNVAPAVRSDPHPGVVEFNDLEALGRALAQGDVACVLAEPALTNIGIVLPEPGFHAALRGMATGTGTLLMIDETHTLSAGPGGAPRPGGSSPISSRSASPSGEASPAGPTG